METIPGSGNWKLTIRREAAGITILRAATCDARARLPETLYGLPVTALGDHALSPTAASAEGEDLLVTCGTGTDPGTWSNRDLEDLTLPRSLERVGDYALMNCGGLRTLRLHDGIGQWGGGVLMNCRRLAAFHLTRVGEQGDTLAWFADELPWELDVTVEETDGAGRGRLIQKNKFSVGETIEIMKPDGRNLEAVVREIRSEDGELQESAPHSKQVLWVGFEAEAGAEPYDILRRREEQAGE